MILTICLYDSCKIIASSLVTDHSPYHSTVASSSVTQSSNGFMEVQTGVATDTILEDLSSGACGAATVVTLMCENDGMFCCILYNNNVQLHSTIL